MATRETMEVTVMRRRMVGWVALAASGGVFQFTGCESEKLGEIVAASFRSTAVDVGTFVIESAVDGAFGWDAEAPE